MPKQFHGNLNAKNKNFAILVTRFNEFITSKLLEGALDCLFRNEADRENINIYWIPGSYEFPVTAQKIAKTGKYDAIICLGAIIRGATSHFDYVASVAAKGIANASLSTGVPMIFGVLTTDTIEQAIERAGTKAGNKGWDAALAAIEMVDLFSKI
ncbi:MAG: 6,7-dimethyl-8-ribityllumazine synthase [Desulfobacterales bacterium SG8_35_2]|nr:MAG: 6,7-dimethyl-8-ribityllumazine synthase [Desulfobacterales bacterium SG8_35_2]